MNKLLTTIVGAALGLTMTVGVGVAVANSATKETSPVHAAENESHAFSQSIQQVLNGNAAIDSISISEQSYPIKQVNVHYRYNKTNNTSVSCTVSVAGNEVDTKYITGTGSNYANLEFPIGSSVKGAVSITFANTGNSASSGRGTLWVDNVYLIEGADDSKTTTNTSITVPGNKTVLDSTASPADSVQLSASVTYEGGTISNPGLTWTSSNTSVATVAAGLVTAVGVGKTTITASYAGNSTYNSSTDSVDIWVKNPNQAVFNFADLANDNSWVSGTAYTPIVVNDVTLSTSSGGNNAKYYSSDNSWRMYNGGSLTITAPSGKYISSVSSSPSHTFNIDSDATFASASFSETVQFTEITVTLTNIAPQILYTVSYDANLVDYTGAVPSSSTQTSQGSAITVAAALSCDGYTFNGWNTQANGEGTNVTPGATNYVPTSNHTLYGKWTENQSSGESLTFNLTSNPGSWPTDNSSELTDYIYSLNSVDYTFSLKNVKCNSGYLMCTATAVIGLPALSGYKLTKVIAHNSSSCSTATKVGISSKSDDESYITGGAIQTWGTTSSAYTYNLSNTEEDTQYYLYVTNKNAQILDLKLTYEEVETKTIVSSRMVSGTASASTGDTNWTLSGFKFFVTYEGELETEVTDKTTFNVAESVPTINDNGNMDITVTPTFKGVEFTAKAATVSATLIYVNLYSIEHLYDIELALNGTQSNVTFDGIYMGESGGGIILMNGAYGMLVYGQSGSSYTVGETYLTVTGTLKNYNYLYEIYNDASLSITSLNDTTRKSRVGIPSTYIVTGSESASTLYLANRKTSLSGTVYSVNGSTTANTAILTGDNNSVYVTVGGNNILLYIKTAQATSEVADIIKVGQTITVEGFTTYYKNNNVATFEVMFTNLVEADANYHAANFARDLLKLTMGTCNSSYDGVTNNGSTLTGIWTTLAGADYWLKVEANGEDSDFIGTTPNSAIVVPTTTAGIDAMSDADALAAAAYRYDYCTAKYNLSNFAGRTLTVSFNSRVGFGVVNNSSNIVAVVVILSMLSFTTIGGYYFFKKRKEQ